MIKIFTDKWDLTVSKVSNLTFQSAITESKFLLHYAYSEQKMQLIEFVFHSWKKNPTSSHPLISNPPPRVPHGPRTTSVYLRLCFSLHFCSLVEPITIVMTITARTFPMLYYSEDLCVVQNSWHNKMYWCVDHLKNSHA